MNFAIVPIVLASISSGMSKDLPPAVLDGGFTSFQTAFPRSVQSWERRRTELRKKLRRLLGDLPEPFTPKVTIHERLSKKGYNLERFTFDNGIGDTVYGYVLIPAGHKGRGPAILYNHYHGVRLINAFQEYLYKLYGKAENCNGLLYKGVGHEYTPEMRRETLSWLKKHL